MSRRTRSNATGVLLPLLLIAVALVVIVLMVRALRGGSQDPQQQAAVQDALITPSPEPGQAATSVPTLVPSPAPTAVPTASLSPSPAPALSPSPSLSPSPTPAADRAPTEAEIAAAVSGYVTGDGVNLRKGPTTDTESIGKYNKEEILAVYAEENGFYFVKITSDSKLGFISTKYVVKGALPVIPENVPTDAVGGYVRASKAALRDGPDKANKCLKELYTNAQVYIYYQTGEFYYVEDVESGLKGFVVASYITPDGPVPAA